ncbi:MAG: hypothetical protein CMM74_04155 [Rhodospirillaceae bacterium]|nr:hypothetical protein [Rhodospirillaceae bacterium]
MHNFYKPHKPNALRLPAGFGRPLAEDMERLIEELLAAIPAAFEDRNRHQSPEEESQKTTRIPGLNHRWRQRRKTSPSSTPRPG